MSANYGASYRCGATYEVLGRDDVALVEEWEDTPNSTTRTLAVAFLDRYRNGTE